MSVDNYNTNMGVKRADKNGQKFLVIGQKGWNGGGNGRDWRDWED